MNKTQLARDCFDDIQEQYTNAGDVAWITGGDGVRRPTKEFRAAVVVEIMNELGTTRQNAGTYLSRIFRERHYAQVNPKKKAKKKVAAAQRRKTGKQSLQSKSKKTGPFQALRTKEKARQKIKDDNKWLDPKKRSGRPPGPPDEQDMGTGFLENLDITPDGDIIAPIKRIDKSTAIYLGNEAMELLRVLEEYHGLEIARSKSQFQNGYYQMDIRFSVKDSGGNAQTPEAQDFLAWAPHHEIPKEFLFKEFEVDGKALCIIGWKRRATKNKILFLKDGKRFVTRVDSMKRYLSKAGLIDG